MVHSNVRMGMVAAGLSIAAAFIAPTAAQAQDWGTKPVTIVVPYNPGASNDSFARGLAEALSEGLGQPVVIENRAGAAGFVGSSYVSRSDPDGYTLLFTSDGVSRVGRKPKVEFDVFKDLTPISITTQAPLLLVVNSEVPVDNVQEFIKWANANEETTFYGTVGVGSTTQLHAEIFNSLAGTKLKGATYKSAAPAINDLAGGRIQSMFATMSAAGPQIDAGRVKLLAYTGPYAPPSAPKAPTIAEAGVEGFDAAVWYGVYGPPGMPEELVVEINAAVSKATMSDIFTTLMDNSGATPVTKTSMEVVEYIKGEIAAVDDLVASGAIAYK